MGILNRIITLSSCLALAGGGAAVSTGCAGGDRADLAPVTLDIRFQDSDIPPQSPAAGILSFAPTAADGPTTFDQVAKIQVDISFADTSQLIFTNFELTKFASNEWHADVPSLPRDKQLRFFARALNADGEEAFSGETLATLAAGGQSVEIPIAPKQNNQTFPIPRMFRIAYPTEMFSGQEQQFTFTIQGNAGAAIGFRLTAPADPDPTKPSPAFFPATGTVTLTNTVANFISVYTAPDVTVDTPIEYQVTITDARALTAVAVTTNFRITIKPRPPGDNTVANTEPSVLFNPVILSLTANGSKIPDTVELVPAVSDDGAPDQLSYQWSYTPDAGTPGATFDHGGLDRIGLFQNYTVQHQGTITLAVTDEHDGTTTLHYQLAVNQFADAINHTIGDGLKRIVAGDAHTCVLTGQNRVRCWGDNQFGQLGYGNALDVGATPTTLPFSAGDVPLPVTDPVLQLVAGNNHTCTLMQSGYIYCWGRNNFGQLGYDRTANLGDGEPVTSFGFVNVGDRATRIAAGGDHTCAILQSGALRCWGRNDFGQLGRGDRNNIGDDEPVYSAGNVDLGAGVTVADLALGDSHTCALLTTGAVRCWGRNDFGQLGYGNSQALGDNEPINNLANVSLTGKVRKIVAGTLHTCALTDNGTLRCWGRNFDGQLGQSYPGFLGIGNQSAFSNMNWGDQSNELPSALPSDINVGAQVTDVVAGDFHTCALLGNGQLKCWGAGSFGELGYGDFNNVLVPPQAGVNLDGVSAYGIAAGAAHTCALRSNGTARCWGAGADGRLGRGSTANFATATGDVDIKILGP